MAPESLACVGEATDTKGDGGGRGPQARGMGFGESVPISMVQGQGGGKKKRREHEREKKRNGVWCMQIPGNATKWSSGSLITSSSDASWWRWTYSAVPSGTWVRNCSSTTTLTTLIDADYGVAGQTQIADDVVQGCG